MIMTDLSNTLKNKAILLGLCTDWTNAWGDPDKQGLIDKYLHGIDFCIKHDYPSVEFIKKHFEKELLRKNNIFVDEDIHERNLNHIAVFNGKCSGMLMFDGLSCCDLYARHDSVLTIDCTRMSKVFVNLYDNAKVRIIQKDIASVYVYKHGDNCCVEYEGEVMVRNSNK